MNFTQAQENAINAQNGTLLIAAGAGSGKTSVLTERIIKKVCGDYNITDFLVVTFTRASANDLKNKIARALNNKLSENINNAHLKRQQILLGRASISTMHSFCLDLVNANFEKLGVPAKFRIADENEIDIIKRRLLDKLLDDYYNSESQVYEGKSFAYVDFIFALENFINARDDENIYNIIFKIYNKIINHAKPFKVFDEQIELMWEIHHFEDFFKTKFGTDIKNYYQERVSNTFDEINKSLDIIKTIEKIEKKYSQAFFCIRGFFARFSSILSGGSYNNIYELCADYKNIKIGSHRLNDERELELKDYLDARHKILKEEITNIQEIFAHDFEDLKRFAKAYEKILEVLKDFLSAFDRQLQEEKKRLKSFEFSDLERFSLELLVEKVDENGEVFPTDLAKRLKENYREIYIDEYQDTNKIQDMIFKVISTENHASEYGNRFMVGDIKQSIYAFRGAKPHIFAGYSHLFSEFIENRELIPQKIYLRKNFRSSYNIISFINYIFENLFSEELGGVNYTGGEVLENARIFESEEADKIAADVTFALVEKDSNEDDDPPELKTDGIISEIISNEAEYTALTIKNLIENGKLKNGEKIMPGDITILMRNYTHAEIFAETLKKYNIMCYTDKTKGFLHSAEIMLVLSLLRVIDNPARDIDLAGILKSPVFNFSLDDLIYIKKLNAEASEEMNKYIAPLFSYVRIYAEHGNLLDLKNKCADFLAKLNIWRAKSRILPVDKFIWYIYRQTDIINKMSWENLAAERKANLNLLYEYARKFEATTFKGLYEFLNYLNDVEAGSRDFDKAKIISENSGTVRIMSVHKSKGLEFPVCIFANTGQKFSNKDYTQDLIASEEEIYFNLKYKDEIGYEKTPFKKLCAEKIKKDSRSEEARILYVALTRAIEKLIIIGSVGNISEFLAKNTSESQDLFTRKSLIYKSDSNLKWLSALLLNADGSNKTNINFNINFIEKYNIIKMIENLTGLEQTAETEENSQEFADLNNLNGDELWQLVEYEQKIHEMYHFNYKKDFLSKMPVKIAVSDIIDLNKTEEEYASGYNKNFEMSPLPRFLEEETGANAALKGTATHLFMQFADFEYAEFFGAQNEAANLLNGGFLTEAQYDRINFDAIDKFLSSDLYARIKSAEKIYRETPFLLKVPVSSEILSEMNSGLNLSDLSGEYILIQGAIDLFFEDSEGKINIVDFKTDYIKSNEGDKILIERHKRQLDYYCMAAGEITSRQIGAAYIYSFALGREIKIV